MNEESHQLVCISCPLGCTLSITPKPGEEPEITGFRCQRGFEYAHAEMANPRRILTTTVTVVGGRRRRLAVKTDGSIPKAQLLAAARLLQAVTVNAPVRVGQVVVANLVGTGVSVVATSEVAEEVGAGC